MQKFLLHHLDVEILAKLSRSYSQIMPLRTALAGLFIFQLKYEATHLAWDLL